jgi:membrane-associated phospholipid phosphatase
MQNNLLEEIKHSKYFLISFLLFEFVLLYFCFAFPKGSTNYLLNKLYVYEWLNFIMKYSTHLGDGLSIIVFLIICLFVNKNGWKKYLLIFINFALSGGIAQLLKRLLNQPRPKGLLGNNLIYINDINIHSSHSMPSGHTITIFSFIAILILIYRNKFSNSYYQIVLLLFAIIIALTRVYVNQHFLEDIAVGASIGVFVSYAIKLIGYKFLKIE